MTTTISRRVVACAVALAACGLAIGTGVTASAADAADFVGRWTAIDQVDGSNLRLTVTPNLKVRLFDDFASACDGERALATGQGVLLGDSLVIDEFFVNCLGTSPDIVVPYQFDLQPDGTLAAGDTDPRDSYVRR